MGDSLSVVICNYNGARFLPESVESVLAQEVKLLEIVVVDDGSDDDPRSRIEPYLDRIVWLPRPHAGQAAALNAALARCRGEWVAFLESDDVWLPGKLKTVGGCLRDNPELVAVQHSMSQVDARLKPLPTWLPQASRRQDLHDFLEGRSLLTGLSALAARRDVLANILPLPQDLLTCVDEYIQPRLLFFGPIKHIAQPLGLRRVHDQNFYAGIRQNPARLRFYLAVRSTLDAHLDAFLKKHDLKLSPPCARQRQTQRLELELLSQRFKGSWGQAIQTWMKIAAIHGFRPYSLFKAATLATALLWPPLYFRLTRIYENNTWLPKLRARLLP